MPPRTMTTTATTIVEVSVTSQPKSGAAYTFAEYATAATVIRRAIVYSQPDMNAKRGPTSRFVHWKMPPANGYCEATSPNVKTTRNWPIRTIGYDQMNAGPAAARPKAKSVYTPTTGDRYVKPTEKFESRPSDRLSCWRYPRAAS